MLNSNPARTSESPRSGGATGPGLALLSDYHSLIACLAFFLAAATAGSCTRVSNLERRSAGARAV